jgi:hypothetical protein
MDILSVISQFASFKHALIETNDTKALHVKTMLEIGKCFSRDRSIEKLVFISTDDYIRNLVDEIATEHDILNLTPQDLEPSE